MFTKTIFTRAWRFAIFLSFILVLSTDAAAQTKLLRFPDIHGDRVAFTYGGDIWTAPATGGTAIRLTAHPGMEVFAKFSPDGNWIAFTGQYDGDEQVYLIPATGGVPRQLTFYPAKGPLAPRWGWDNQVYGWSRDGKRIFFRSLRDSWSLPIAKLYSVSVDGGPAEPLPIRCRKPVREITPLMVGKWSTRRNLGISGLRSATAEARPMCSTSSI